MFYTVDLMKKFFQRCGDLALYLLGPQSGSSHKYICHGHNDLGLLLKETLPGAGGSAGPDDSLLDSGLDSVGMVDLLAAVEERFGLAVPPEEITPENFATPRSLATLIERLKGR